MAKRGKAEPTEYVVSREPGTTNTYAVWKDGMEEPYLTTLIPRACTCPDWVIRRRDTGSKCKHHILVEDKIAKGEIF